MDKNAKVLVIGENGVEGKHLLRYLKNKGIQNVFTENSSDLNVMNEKSVDAFFKSIQFDIVFLLHTDSGGILANIKNATEFAHKNIQVQNNIIPASHRGDVKKLIFLASSCVYPKNTSQPIKESQLRSGELEETSKAYAKAKIAGIELCNKYNNNYGTKFISVIPASIYGPNDNFDPDSSHVVAALIKKCYEARLRGAREVMVWGSGAPRREFIYVDDLINACMVLIENDFAGVVNVGCGEDITIRALAELIKESVGFEGAITFDMSKPDGVFQKLLDSSRITSMGWKPQIALSEGIDKACVWFAENYKE
ncbi:GDP-L-fucose synthase family protein [Candidatus Omnitrophota bacterium]